MTPEQQQAAERADAIVAMRPLAARVAHSLTGKSVLEIATLMAYTLLLLEHAAASGKGISRPMAFQVVGDIADDMRAASVLYEAPAVSETRQ